jgi:hypothetical protein
MSPQVMGVLALSAIIRSVSRLDAPGQRTKLQSARAMLKNELSVEDYYQYENFVDLMIELSDFAYWATKRR